MEDLHYFVNTQKLSNGLPLTVINGIDIQSVTIMLIVGAGSRYEPENISGTAHFLEHMFFKGSSNYPSSNKLAMAMEMIGGLSNAFTSYDYTGYYIKVPLKNYKKAIELLADIIINPVFKENEFIKERGVIEEEIRMYEDLPYEKIKDEFNSNLFLKHPLGRNIAGSIKSLQNISTKSLNNFRTKYYHPQNMHLVIAGELSEQKIVTTAEKYFTQFVGNKIIENPKITSEGLMQTLKSKHIHINRKTEQSHIVIGGLSYPRNHELEYPLKVGMTLMTDGFGSRLFQSLREKYGIAYYVSGGVASYEDIGKYYIRAGISNTATQRGVDEILKTYEDISKGKFSQKELDRAKNYHIASILNNVETGEDKAGWYGLSNVLKKRHKSPEKQIEEIEQISVHDIKDAWAGVIREDNILVAIISDKDIKY